MAEKAPTRQDVEAALARIQEWPGLARSPQLAKFLSYIVTSKLDGDEANIKAYSIAVDVFGRPPSFDPQSDPIVRVQARRLRALLNEYYAGGGDGSVVRFDLPVGRYVPEFIAGDGESPLPVPGAASEPDAPVVQPKRRGTRTRLVDIGLAAVFTLVVVGVMAAVFQVLQPRPERIDVPKPPTVSVSEFASVATGGARPVSVAGLAVELVTDLGLFPYIVPSYQQRLETGNSTAALAQYEISGVARSEGEKVQVTASLRRTGSDTVLWARTTTVGAGEIQTKLDDISRSFADQLGAFMGPLHADALRWLSEHRDQNLAGNESAYLCGLLFTQYRETGSAELGNRAAGCVDGLQQREPGSPSAIGMAGSMLLDRAMRSQVPGEPDPAAMEEAGRLLRQALDLAPTSSPIWREYGLYLEVVGRPDEAEAAFVSALQLNPANLDAVAAYGRLLSLRGPSAKGEALANDALARSLSPPYWYHEAPAINALRDGKDELAIAEAEKLVSGDTEMASVVATAAAFRMSAEDVLNRYIAQLLEVTRFRRFGILPVLRQRLPDAELVTAIANVLKEAGIEPAVLEGPF